VTSHEGQESTGLTDEQVQPEAAEAEATADSVDAVESADSADSGEDTDSADQTEESAEDADEAGEDADETGEEGEAGEEAPAEADPVEELRAALRRAPGDWYVVHSYAGYENKVKTNLETRAQTLDVEDFIFQVEVPTEEVTEIKNGKRQLVNRKVFPGYILVRMELTDDSWGAVRNTPGVLRTQE
jgi:transcriptional antiterminator NusG